MNNGQVRRFTITVRGHTDSAFEQALAEATRRINDGCLSGADSADDSAFYFDSTDDVPVADHPR